jgi:hypothetical protein
MIARRVCEFVASLGENEQRTGAATERVLALLRQIGDDRVGFVGGDPIRGEEPI